MCNEPYTRPLRLFPNDGLVIPVRCTFLVDHGANHSWYALKISDDAALETLREEREAGESDLPAHIVDFITEVEAGEHDPYIEALLAALHDRKRCRRGVAGFRSPRRHT